MSIGLVVRACRVTLTARSWDPRSEEVKTQGGNGRKWERECVQRDAFVWKMIYNNRRNARSVYIAFQKALFTAFIAFMKKTENMLKEEIILNEVRFGGSPPINGTLRARRPCVQPWQGRYWTSKLKWLDLQTCGRSWQKSYYRLLNLRLEFFLDENIINIKH